ncbi:porin [Marinobacterium weihaiense]|uniref:Porin n=1 Tax=Marinobacterium weihaiense TaxID=2851016 RepID=A0ABS6M8N8_9GAMM|nr:porin [Marinobacterium weihaiense]MBV0932643.1 porin [Marinobacterium weihaiense]
MKKLTLALMVAAALPATHASLAHADTTLYGSLRVELDARSSSDLDLRDGSSRFGLKGDVDLGLDHTQGLFHWEANVDTTDNDGTMFSPRLAYVGATGDWGTLLLGKQWQMHYIWTNSTTDIFNAAAADGGERFQLGGFAGHWRPDNSLSYLSPTFGNWQLAGHLVIAGSGSDNDGEQDDTLDSYDLNVKYEGERVYLAASYGNIGSNAGGVDYDLDSWALGTRIKVSDPLSFVARYENQQGSGTSIYDLISGTNPTGTSLDVDREVLEAGLLYKTGAFTWKVRGTRYEENNTGVELNQWAAGVQYDLGNRARLYFNYIDNDADDSVVSYDRTVLGYRLDF